MNTKHNGLISMPLRDVWYVFWNHKGRFIGMTLLGALVGVLVMMLIQMRYNMHPQTVTTAAMAIITENKSGTFSNGSENPNAAEVYLAEDMTDAVIYVAKSNTVLNQVITDLNLVNVSVQQFQDALELEQYEDSQIIQLTFTWPNQAEGVQILTRLVEILPNILIKTLKIGSVEIVDFPETATYILGANAWTIAIFAVLGVTVALCTCMYTLVIRPGFYSAEYLEASLECPILGEIPAERSLKDISSGNLNEFGNLLLPGRYIESCASAAYTIIHQMKSRDQKILCVTSSTSGEGKTAVCASIAWQMSQQKQKVLVVDFDTRHPSLGKYFTKDIHRENTLNAIVKNGTTLDDAVVHVNEYLDILPSYLEEHRLHVSEFATSVLTEKCCDYDCILIDTPPVGLVSDALYLNQIKPQVLMVVRQAVVWQDLVRSCKEQLDKTGAEVLGLVFNGINTKTPITRYYYRHYGYDYYPTQQKRKVRSK